MSLISAGKALGVDYLVSSTSHAMQSTTIMRRTCASQPGAVLISPRAPAPQVRRSRGLRSIGPSST